MSFRVLSLGLFFCSALGVSIPASYADPSLTAETIVIYNSTVPESGALAKFYAQKRGIPHDHLVPLACPKEEEISRTEYDGRIAGPLRAIFRRRHWWTLLDENHPERGVLTSSIRFVALIKGMPLKIRSVPNYPGDKPSAPPIGDRNDASVDSELAALARFSNQISGPAINTYFNSFLTISDFADSSLMLVCRLDAPTTETVRRMILDSIATEKTGLWGRAYVDGAHNSGSGLELGDKWLANICGQLQKVGIPVVYDDTPALFPVGFPVTDCALYYGWYAPNIAGPFAQPDFHFLPGAVAVHIHSYSAATLRDPNANWVGPLLQHGAAASIGNVYEPYLQLTSNLDIFNDRLLHGFTFAESAYMSIRAVSWMSVMVGDPLYRPYGSWLQFNPRSDNAKSASVWKMYHDFVLQSADTDPAVFRKHLREVASHAGNGPMIEDLGLMEMRDGNFAAATSCFEQARTLYTGLGDILRVVLEDANAAAQEGKPQRALAVLRGVLRVLPDSPATALLRQMEHQLAPESATPATKP